MKTADGAPLRLCNDKLRLIVTARCNLDCFYCHNEGQPKSTFDLSAGVLEVVEQVLVDTDIREVTISGGEALLNPGISDIVETSARLSGHVTLVSNGLLVADNIDRLASAGLTSLRLGVDSLNPVKPRPSPGTLDSPFRLAETIDVIRSRGLNVELNIVLSRFNRRTLGDLIAFVVDVGVDAKFFELVDVDEFGSSEAIGVMSAAPISTAAEFFAVCEAMAGRRLEPQQVGEFGPANLAVTIDRSEIRFCRYLCPYGLCWTTGTRIDPEGYVYSCMKNRGRHRVADLDDVDDWRAMLQAASGYRCASLVA